MPPGPSAARKLSAIEIAKALAPLRALTATRADFDAIKATLVDPQSVARVDQIIDGISQEDEFALFCRAMETCDSCAKLDQTPVVESEEKIADFLASFHPGLSVKGLDRSEVGVRFNCFVEVKSSLKPKFSISKKDLDSRRQFARRFGLPLVIAVRFRNFQSHTVWIMMDAEFLERRGRKIECADLLESLTHVLFDDYGLYAPPDLHLVHYYERDRHLQGAGHPDFGALTGMSLLLSDRDPIPLPADTYVLASALLHSFEQTTIHTDSVGTRTAVVASVGNQMRLLSDLVFSMNYLPRTESGEPSFNARQVLAGLDSQEKALFFRRSLIEKIVAHLNSLGKV